MVKAATNAIITYLCRPPPLASVHLVEEPECVVRICVVPLGKEDEVLVEFGLAVECFDTLNDVTKVDVEKLAIDFNLLTLERWARGRQRVNDYIDFTCILERQTKLVL